MVGSSFSQRQILNEDYILYSEQLSHVGRIFAVMSNLFAILYYTFD